MSNLRVVDQSLEDEFARLNDEEETEAGTTVQAQDFGPVPEPPDFLGFEAQLEWINSAPELHLRGKLNGATRSQFENYCVLIGMAREMNAAVENDGKIINGRIHPGIRLMRDCIREAQSIYALLFKRETAAQMEREQEVRTVAAQAEWGGGLLAKS